MPAFLTPLQYSILEAVCARLVPSDDAPDGAEMGAVDYIDTLLGAFTFTPPRIWAGGPFSGRFGGESSFSDFEELSPPRNWPGALASRAPWAYRKESGLGRSSAFRRPIRAASLNWVRSSWLLIRPHKMTG